MRAVCRGLAGVCLAAVSLRFACDPVSQRETQHGNGWGRLPRRRTGRKQQSRGCLRALRARFSLLMWDAGVQPGWGAGARLSRARLGCGAIRLLACTRLVPAARLRAARGLGPVRSAAQSWRSWQSDRALPWLRSTFVCSRFILERWMMGGQGGIAAWVWNSLTGMDLLGDPGRSQFPLRRLMQRRMSDHASSCAMTGFRSPGCN